MKIEKGVDPVGAAPPLAMRELLYSKYWFEPNAARRAAPPLMVKLAVYLEE